MAVRARVFRARRFTRRATFASILAVGLVVAQHARAESGSNPVQYSKVDASTVRVFALGTVGVSTIDGPTTPIQIAAPHAGHGTGFAVEPDLIITAQHVVNG